MKRFNLENHPKIKTGFVVPEGYFEQFSENILNTIAVEEKPVVSLFERNKKWMLAVAAVLMVGLMIPFLNQSETSAESLDSNTLENYLAYQSTITPEEIVSLLDHEDIEAIETNLNLDDAAVEKALSGNTYLENYITE